jgi:cytochrome c peroxidase
VPQLYNLKDAPFLGHGASFANVKSVLHYKNKAQPSNANVPRNQLAAEFVPLNLTDEEIHQLVTFVEGALYDPYLTRYVPSALPSGFCFPNNDPLSRLQMGCR